jgi:hypothetical protein
VDWEEAFNQLQHHDLILRLVWGVVVLIFNSLVSPALTISGLFEFVKQPP